MNTVKIRGLEITACHGVHDFEKTKPQRFLFDADIEVDFYAAAKADDLSGTVNYSAVCNLIADIARGNVFNLIEKLAYECAFSVMERFLQVKGITLTVFKPDAPVKHPFRSVAVTVGCRRETVYLSLGSSQGDKKALLDAAVKKLDATRGITVQRVSDVIETAPYGGVAKNPFLNCAVKASTFLSPRNLLDEIHRIESECGRVRDVRWGDRTLDIDIVFYGGSVIREDGLVIPHPDYHNREFVLTPLKQIAPEMFCPVQNDYVKNLDTYVKKN